MPVPGARGLAALVRKARTPARNSASSGVSSKSMGSLPSQRGVCRLELSHQALFPAPGAAERQGQQLGAAIVKVAVELPSEPHATVYLDVLLGRQEIGLVGRNPRSGGGQRQLGGIAAQGPGAIVGIGARELSCNIDVGELVLDRLKRADRTRKCVALQSVVARHFQRPLRAAHLFEGK